MVTERPGSRLVIEPRVLECDDLESVTGRVQFGGHGKEHFRVGVERVTGFRGGRFLGYRASRIAYRGSEDPLEL